MPEKTVPKPKKEKEAKHKKKEKKKDDERRKKKKNEDVKETASEGKNRKLGEKVQAVAANFIRRFFNEKKFVAYSTSSSTQHTGELGDLQDREKVAFYDNVDDNVTSPGDNSTQTPDEEEFTANLYNRSVPCYKHEAAHKDRIFLTVATFNIAAAVMFPVVMMRNGGFYFLLQFLICTIFVVVPLNFMQFFLSQFTSLPPSFIYHRMAPVTIGFGIITILAQYMVSSTTRFEHRFMAMALEVITGLTASRTERNRGSNVYGILQGHDPNYCEENDLFIRGTCVNRDNLINRVESEREFTLLALHKLLQNDDQLLNSIAPKLSLDRVFHPKYDESHYHSAILLTVLAAFFVTLKGSLFFAKHLRNFVFYGTTTFVLLMLVVSGIYWKSTISVFVQVIGADISTFGNRKNWGIALTQALSIFSSTDGTVYGVGFISHFKNNFVKDVIYQTFIGFLVLILFTFSFGNALVQGVIMAHYQHEKKDLTPVEIRDHLFNDDDFFNYIFHFFFQNDNSPFFMIIFSALFTLWQSCGQAILAQLTVTAIYRFFRTLVRLPNFIVNYVILSVHFTIIFFVHAYLSRTDAEIHVHAPIFMVFQLVSVSIFSYKSIFPCLYTIFKDHRYRLRQFRFPITIYYQFILVIILAYFFCSGTYWRVSAKTMMVPMVGLGLMNVHLLILQICYYSLKSNLIFAFLPTNEWGPMDISEKLQYLKQERACSG